MLTMRFLPVGKGHPPLYGDMEAQRNWMSITNHLPVSQWYWHNLDYWGLDYPPLTAYHSYLLGRLARIFGNPRWVELSGKLGGKEVVFREEKAILFLRSTVITGDILFWMLPVALWCALRLGRWKARPQENASTSRRSSRTLVRLAFIVVAWTYADARYTDDSFLLHNATAVLGFDRLRSFPV